MFIISFPLPPAKATHVSSSKDSSLRTILVLLFCWTRPTILVYLSSKSFFFCLFNVAFLSQRSLDFSSASVIYFIYSGSSILFFYASLACCIISSYAFFSSSVTSSFNKSSSLDDSVSYFFGTSPAFVAAPLEFWLVPVDIFIKDYIIYNKNQRY